MKETEDIPLNISSHTKPDIINKDNLSPSDIADGLSVHILEDYLGEQTISNLLNAKIYTLGDLNDLILAYLQVMNSEESIMDHAIQELANAAKSLILEKGLQVNALLDGIRLYDIIYNAVESLEKKLRKFKLLKTIQKSKSLSDELDFIFQDLSGQEKKLFIKYTLDKMAYSEIGDLFGVSNERIRQIYSNSVDSICNRLEDNPNLFLQSVCLIADKLGDELNPQKLENHLKEVGILDSKNYNKDQTTLNICLVLMINKKTSILIDPMYKS